MNILKLIIDNEMIQKIANYLQKRPFEEVAMLLTELQNNISKNSEEFTIEQKPEKVGHIDDHTELAEKRQKENTN